MTEQSKEITDRPRHAYERACTAGSTMHVDSSSIENQFYRATFDLWTGAMTDLELKSSDGQLAGSRAVTQGISWRASKTAVISGSSMET